jgi:anthranilate synthase/aminodeoxychorismate synthase-like glutamine amidotransferase
MILLIDNYDSFTYNLYQYIEELGFRCKVIRNDKISLAGIKKLAPSAIVISPGPGNPDEAGISLSVIEAFAGLIPILGVCLGHQAIGQAFGGKVIRAEKLMHGKISVIKHDGRGVFRGVKRPLEVARYHSLVVEKKSLPKVLEITASTPDGVVMGIRHRKFKVEGVQFHPESIATEEGKKILGNFLALGGKKK